LLPLKEDVPANVCFAVRRSLLEHTLLPRSASCRLRLLTLPGTGLVPARKQLTVRGMMGAAAVLS
jgi:hypothetical protein